MITQIEIDGFKTFKDFKVELAPFQVPSYNQFVQDLTLTLQALNLIQ